MTAEEFLAQRLGTQVSDETASWWAVELWCQALLDARSYDPDWEGTEELLDRPRAAWRVYMDRISPPDDQARPDSAAP